MHNHDDVLGSKMNKQFETGISSIFLYLRARESVKLTQLALNGIQQHFLIKNRLVDTILIRELMQSLGVLIHLKRLLTDMSSMAEFYNLLYPQSTKRLLFEQYLI